MVEEVMERSKGKEMKTLLLILVVGLSGCKSSYKDAHAYKDNDDNLFWVVDGSSMSTKAFVNKYFKEKK